MRWLLGVVMVCTGVARAEEAVKHRPSPVAVRLSLLLGGNFIISPPRVCPLCWPPVDPQQPYVERGVSTAFELAVVMRGRSGEGYFANQVMWNPLPTEPVSRFEPVPFSLYLTTEVGFLGRVHPRVLFGPGVSIAATLAGRQFDNVIMPAFALRSAVFLDAQEVHRLGVNFTVLARLRVLGAVLLPTVSYSVALP